MKQMQRRLRDDTRVHETRLMQRMKRFPFFNPIESASLPVINVEGKELINFGSNNYLGLSTDPRVVEAAIDATRKWGTGVTGSRLLNGTLALHERLETLIADFYGKESALVFSTGYAANLGLCSGMLKANDNIVIDREIHASVVDALMLAQVQFRRFAHNNSAMASRLLGRAHEAIPSAVIVEGIYSMRGDAGRIAELADVADKAGALLVVDEAHGLGTVGSRGRGGSELAGALDRVDIITITFSKTLGSCGGAVVGPKDVIEALRIHAKPFVFTASNTPGSIASAHRALEILNNEPELVGHLQARASQLREALSSKGIPTQRSDSSILTIPIGSDFETLQAWRLLRNRGIFCNPVITPGVRKGEGLLRLSVMRTHTAEHIERAAEAFVSIKRWADPSKATSGSLESPRAITFA